MVAQLWTPVLSSGGTQATAAEGPHCHHPASLGVSLFPPPGLSSGGHTEIIPCVSNRDERAAEAPSALGICGEQMPIGPQAELGPPSTPTGCPSCAPQDTPYSGCPSSMPPSPTSGSSQTAAPQRETSLPLLILAQLPTCLLHSSLPSTPGTHERSTRPK